MSESIENNNKTPRPEVVRPEAALLRVFFDAAKTNIEHYCFANRAEAVRATSQANIALLGRQDPLMADYYG